MGAAEKESDTSHSKPKLLGIGVDTDRNGIPQTIEATWNDSCWERKWHIYI
jgi:hypothetical protein